MSQHGLAGFFGLSERFEGRTADLDGALVLMGRTPRRYEAGVSVKAGAAAALITDHERKVAAARVPDFHILDGTNDAGELHGFSHFPFAFSLPHLDFGGKVAPAQFCRNARNDTE